MSEKREMTLDEWMARLPSHHAARREFDSLLADNERLRGLLAEAQKAVWMNYDGDLLDRIEAALKEMPR